MKPCTIMFETLLRKRKLKQNILTVRVFIVQPPLLVVLVLV